MSGISYKANNKRGSFAVFAVMVFMAMLIITGAAVRGAAGKAVDSVSYAFGRLWGISILAEYDIYLKERYGIFGFWGNEVSAEKKLDMYIDRSFGEKDYIKRSQTTCDLDGYEITEPENLKAQIEKAVLTRTKPRSDENIEDGRASDRSIRADWIIKGLPSYGKTEKSYLANLIARLKSGMTLEDAGADLAINSYILTFFKDASDDKGLQETYFRCEVEYIISGQLDEAMSRKKTQANIKTIRNAMNLFYLYSCGPKREAAMSLASALTPGPAALLTQAALLELWAYAEAENDMKLLNDNKTVPFIKKDSNWALTLDNVFGSTADEAREIIVSGEDDDQDREKDKNGGYISPQVIEGEDYQDYLTVLLCGIYDETKLYRIMDLIQMNMKYVYRDDFLLKEYNCGLSYTMKVNGKNYAYEETYQKDIARQ